MFGLSIPHLILILIVVLLVFGTGRLRNFGRDLGGAVNDFKKGLSEGNQDGSAGAPQARLEDSSQNSADRHS